MPKRILIPAIIILILLLGGLLIVSVRTGLPKSVWKTQNQKEEVLRKPKSPQDKTPATQLEEPANSSPRIRAVRDVSSEPNGKQIPIGTKISEQKVTNPPTPPTLPMIRLRYDGKLYEGLLGSYCWPTTGVSTTTVCVDTPVQAPSTAISVVSGDNLIVEIDAHERPLGVSVSVFTSVEEPPLQSIALGPNLVTPFTVDLPDGLYIIRIFGQWAAGDVYYEVGTVNYTFKIEIMSK